jgi:hypothetical protein
MDGLVYLVSNGIICNSLSCSKILANKDGCVKIGGFTKPQRIQYLTGNSGVYRRGDTERYSCFDNNFNQVVGLDHGVVDVKV